MLTPEQSSWGNLRSMEVRLPQYIADEINRLGRHQAYDASHMQVKSLGLSGQSYGDEFYRVGYSFEQTAWPAAQFMLTGVLESIGASSDETYPWHKKYSGRAAGLVHSRFHTTRRFALRLELVDLYRQSLVWQTRIVRHGNWSRPKHEATGFDNALFWQTGYGTEVKIALITATEQLQRALDCAPLIAPVEAVQDNQIDLPRYVAQQLQPGDTLRPLRTSSKGLRDKGPAFLIEHIDADQSVFLDKPEWQPIQRGDFLRLENPTPPSAAANPSQQEG